MPRVIAAATIKQPLIGKKELDTIAEQSLPAAPSVPEDTELPVSEDTMPQIPDEVGPSIPKNVKLESPMNAKQVGAPREGGRVRGTFKETFMEEVRNLGPVRVRRVPSRYRDDDCLLVDSEIDEPKTVCEPMNGKQSIQWREAVESEYSSLLKNDTWELVPPREGKNIVGSHWVLKVKHEDGYVDRFKARLVAQGYSQVKGVDYDEVLAPVARYTSVRSLLALANAHN